MPPEVRTLNPVTFDDLNSRVSMRYETVVAPVPVPLMEILVEPAVVEPETAVPETAVPETVESVVPKSTRFTNPTGKE